MTPRATRSNGWWSGPGSASVTSATRWRSEHWFVVRGRGRAVVDGSVRELTAGMALDIPVTSAHRIENDGTVDLVFIEVQHGDYFGEDDVVRLEDDFGRGPPPPVTAG